MRTAMGVSPQSWERSATWPSTAAATASVGEAKAGYTASPTVSNTTPWLARTAPARSSRWRLMAARYCSGWALSSLTLPSTSVNRKVTVPAGSAPEFGSHPNGAPV